jgi:hypothetical protein
MYIPRSIPTYSFEGRSGRDLSFRVAYVKGVRHTAGSLLVLILSFVRTIRVCIAV